MFKIEMAREVGASQRKLRSPQHAFNLRVKPWQIQPFMIAPVLPGETMKNLLHMSRVVSDPLKDPLMGWWAEYFYFYVKHRDLDARDLLVDMHLSAATDVSSIKSAVADVPMFHRTGIPWTKLCLDKIVEWYFRDEDDTAAHTLDGLPAAKINVEGWWNSLKLESVMAPTAEDHLPGEQIIPHEVAPGFEQHYAQWEAMRAAQITDASFEDYLGSFGVRAPQELTEEVHKPELLRYKKEFAYPANTVDPATGTPSSAAVWSLSFRADKDRFFKEPGFIVGVQVIRPKVLLSAITGSLTAYMDNAFNWLPKTLQEEAYTSLKEFASGAGPTPTAFGQDYWVDLRDLLLHGEQFRNHTATVNSVALPDTTGNVDFATDAMANALFKTTDGTQRFRTDGMTSLGIASSVHRDMTP